MYYRVAIQQQANQLDRPPSWQWQSTMLSSLAALFQFLRPYDARWHNHLRVFSAFSRESLEEQLRQENLGLASLSVTAAHFLQERLICSLAPTRGTSECEGRADQQRTSIAIPVSSAAQSRNGEESHLVGQGMSSLDQIWLELELGPGGDHDIPYSFALPSLVPQVLVWIRLLARRQRGELQS